VLSRCVVLVSQNCCTLIHVCPSSFTCTSCPHRPRALDLATCRAPARLCTHACMQRARWLLPWPRATTLRPSLGQSSSPLSPGLVSCVRRFLTETEQSRCCRSLPRHRRAGRPHTTSTGQPSPLPPLIPPLVPNPPTLFLRPPDHLPCRPSRGDRSRGGHGCRAPPSTAAGTSSNPSNHRNGTLGEQGSLPTLSLPRTAFP
jgi:hypothetical protein